MRSVCVVLKGYTYACYKAQLRLGVFQHLIISQLEITFHFCGNEKLNCQDDSDRYFRVLSVHTCHSVPLTNTLIQSPYQLRGVPSNKQIHKSVQHFGCISDIIGVC